jgi:hypothetical protein
LQEKISMGNENLILTAANVPLKVTNLNGGLTASTATLSGLPLGTPAASATGELGVKVLSVGGVAPVPASVTHTVDISTVTAPATVSYVGNCAIQLIFSNDFVGTFAGLAFTGNTDYNFSLPLLSGSDTYEPMDLVVTTGSCRTIRTTI